VITSREKPTRDLVDRRHRRPPVHLMRDRRAGLQAARVDAVARPARHRPPLRAQTSPAARPGRRRRPRAQRQAPPAPPRRPL